MHCKSTHCECSDKARTACNARLDAATPTVYCKNQFCKHGIECPSNSAIDRSKYSKADLEAVLVELNEHVLTAVRDGTCIDVCYDSARRKVLKTLRDLNCPLEMTREQQNRLIARDILLAEIENEVRPVLRSFHDPEYAGRHLLAWLRSSSILRGQRI